MTLKTTVLILSLITRTIAAPDSQEITSKAVWQPGTQFIRTAMDQCGKQQYPKTADCFLSEMQAAGAPPEAITFTKRLQQETNGQVGFLRDFRETGNVDIAYVDYVFRANENQACFLVNGTPAMIDIDDFKLLPKAALLTNPVYAQLATKFPKVSLWPGDRSGKDYPLVKVSENKEQRFVVGYRLLNGCHACSRVGSVQYAFDFDSNGKFIGASLLSVQAEPAK
jgi:hypothetical protein